MLFFVMCVIVLYCIEGCVLFFVMCVNVLYCIEGCVLFYVMCVIVFIVLYYPVWHCSTLPPGTNSFEVIIIIINLISTFII